MDILHPVAVPPLALGPAGGPRRTYKLKTEPPVLSAQYELTVERQLTLDGRAEPVRRFELPAEPVADDRDDRTGDLFDGTGEGAGRRPASDGTGEGAGRRPASEPICDNVPTSALGDPAALLPAGSGLAKKYRLILALQAYALGLPSGGDGVHQALAVLKPLRGCGTAVPPGEGRVRFRARATGRATVSGLIYCGRWCCPTCGPFISRRRREATVKRAPVVAPAGKHFHFVPTLRHHAGVTYEELRTVFEKVWRRMTQRGPWQRLVLAHIRADEVTYGRNGWHLHKHILLTLPHDADADAFRDWVQGLWERVARKHGRTCDWEGTDWWTPVAPEALSTTAGYLSKLAELDDTESTLLNVAAGEVLGATSKKGSEPWAVPTHAYVEMWHASKRQRTFGVGGLWACDETKAVEDDEEAAAQREADEPVFASVHRNDYRPKRWEWRVWVNGSLANERLRPEWVPRLRAVFGDELVVVCEPGEMPPPTPPDDDGGCGGDAPTEAQGAAVGASEAVVAPVPVVEVTHTEAPESLRENDRMSTTQRVGDDALDALGGFDGLDRLGATDADWDRTKLAFRIGGADFSIRADDQRGRFAVTVSRRGEPVAVVESVRPDELRTTVEQAEHALT